MIAGVGIDLADVAWVREQVEAGPRWAERHFTVHERLQAERRERADPARGLAARWAVKEAVFKALSSARSGQGPALGAVNWRDIEVSLDACGRPTVELHGAMRRVAEALGAARVHVSMTHEGNVAAAVAIVEVSPLDGATDPTGTQRG